MISAALIIERNFVVSFCFTRAAGMIQRGSFKSNCCRLMPLISPTRWPRSAKTQYAPRSFLHFGVGSLAEGWGFRQS